MRSERRFGDRRREERRASDVRLADFTVPQLRKALLTAALLLTVGGLLLYMLRDLIVAVITGVVAGTYLFPLYRWLAGRLGRARLSAIITIVGFAVPLMAVLAYSWIEISDAAEYLDANRGAVVARLNAALQEFPVTRGTALEEDLSRFVGATADQTRVIVEEVEEGLDLLVVSIAVFLFTVFYLLTDHDRIHAYVRGKIPWRYGRLAGEVGRSVRAVVYGALYATVLTQLMKSGIVLTMNLAWDVPLALVLAIASFFLGFFPIIGSWVVYVPVAVYLMVFEANVAGGVAMLFIGFFVNTLFISLYLRPKIAAEEARVLNFYWMFLALVTGVYTFGLIGIIIGPVLIAVLKAVFDTVMDGVRPVGRPVAGTDPRLG
ncbi:MAG: AI-2E family transporter [Gemmatimonadota bacterium]